jgi:peptidoglycan/xylan/chitin deacetylase (PgdA/CDA1 family)
MQLSQRIIGDLTVERPVFFAPPGGYMNRRIRDIAFETGVRVIRTTRWGYNQNPDLGALQCIQVTRHFTEAEFRRVLEFRRRSAVLYAVKEIIKKAVPSQTYESLRGMIFGHSGDK